MGAAKSKADSGASRRSRGKVEDLEAGGGGGGTSFVLPAAAAPAPALPTTPYSSIRCCARHVLLMCESRVPLLCEGYVPLLC